MKTFEEELPDLIDDMHICENEGHGCEIEKYSAYDREYYRCRLRRGSLEAIFAAHEAEMDRVVEEVIGRNFKKSSGKFDAGIYKRNIPRGYQTSPESRAKVINHEHTQQRARYKAMKKRDT